MKRTRIALVGAGKIGGMIAALLLAEDDFVLSVIDISEQQLDTLDSGPLLHKVCLDVMDSKQLAGVLEGHFAVLSATPFYMTESIARAAVMAGCTLP